jgi:hypothetical protein
MTKLGYRRGAKYHAHVMAWTRARAVAACPPDWTVLDPVRDDEGWWVAAEGGSERQIGRDLSEASALFALSLILEARFRLNPEPELDRYAREHAAERAVALAEAVAACPPGWVLRERTMDLEESGFDPYLSSPTILVAVAYRAGTDWQAHPRDLGAVLKHSWGPDSVWGWSWLMNDVEVFEDLATRLRARASAPLGCPVKLAPANPPQSA